MILIIDTSSRDTIFIGLGKDKTFLAKSNLQAKSKQAEKLLPQIEKIITTAKKKLSDIKGIAVVSGPGSFTALRIGVVTANTLSYGLDIPVVEIRHQEFKSREELLEISKVKLKKVTSINLIEPFYGKEPSITKKS